MKAVKKKTMKNIICIAILTCTMLISYGQDNELLKSDLEKFTTAYLDADVDTYVKYTIPTVIEKAGGAEQMTVVAQQELDMYRQGGMQIKTIIPESMSKTYQGDPNQYVVVGQQVVMQVGEADFVKTAYYLAETGDQGNTWKFLNLEAYSRQDLDNYIPGLPAELSIPGAAEPMIIKN